MSVKSVTKKYFDLESKRALLAKEGNLNDLKKTYLIDISLPNNNTGNFWDEKFSSSHEKTLSNPMEVDRNVTAASWFKCILKNGNNTLNIGSGDGNFERCISSISTEFSHTCADIAEKSLARLKGTYPKYEFVQLDLLKDALNTYKAKFDVITVFEVLEHIPPRKIFHALKNVSFMLQKGGYLMVSVPMNEGLEEMFPYNPNEHLRCYTEELIFAELQMSGFSVVKSVVFFAFPKFYLLKTLLARYMLKKRWKPNNILILCKKL